jgi:hypothetical protein
MQILGRTQGVIVASTMKVDGVWWNDVELASSISAIVALSPVRWPVAITASASKKSTSRVSS